MSKPHVAPIDYGAIRHSVQLAPESLDALRDIFGRPETPIEDMALRDWFAGQIAPGLLSCPSLCIEEGATSAEFAKFIAKTAGAIADAMLAERAKTVQEKEVQHE